MFKKIVGLGFSTKGKNAKDVGKYIQSLVDGGATEFFTGYNPAYWSDKFGFEVSPNGRFAEHEQITDIETLRLIVTEVHKHNLELFVNLNAWYYTDETFSLVQQMVSEFEELGMDGIICGNISILEYLKERKYTGKINISTILAVYNMEAIGFFLENYTINKIILSREVTLKEIESIVTEFPETKFEVFGEGDFCRYNNGLCFAEHKYGAKDICTIVVNDLVIKKRFHPDFKKIILDESLNNFEKLAKLDEKYMSCFEEIESILSELDLGLGDLESLEKQLYKVINQNKNRVDLFYDSMKPINDIRNKNILIFLKGVKYLVGAGYNEFNGLINELEQSVQSGLQFNLKKAKELGGDAKLKAQELASFYSKGDNLNLYSYLFFSQFQNIETVKFPTRGRNYNEKIQLITDVVESGKLDTKQYLDRNINIERAHYDLTYLFGDKLWFREMLKEI
ncbi:hypothetical protein A9Q91_00880 [Candidatus Gracilibacteria bacterium 28_42_T64]|nr:hypothetical protein A9Q91_00880 [Candidatus Gracilibacteria bacterium 28_42_T64]